VECVAAHPASNARPANDAQAIEYTDFLIIGSTFRAACAGLRPLPASDAALSRAPVRPARALFLLRHENAFYRILAG
jgi:hypothetical protein